MVTSLIRKCLVLWTEPEHNYSVLWPALMPFESMFADIKWKLVGQQDMYNYVGVMNNYSDKACIKQMLAGCISVRL